MISAEMDDLWLIPPKIKKTINVQEELVVLLENINLRPNI